MRMYTNKSALVVDDEPGTRLLLREALETLGMTVTEAVDGSDAIHKSLLSPFELTTMDILMPHVNGLDAIRAIRMVDPAQRIIVVTSCKEHAMLEAIRALHVAQIIHKPIRLQEFMAAVHATLAGAPAAEPVSAIVVPREMTEGV